MSTKTTFVVMLRNGTYEDCKSRPIHTCDDRRDADRMASNKNQAAAWLAGKMDARNLMMEYWNDTHQHHVEEDVRSNEVRLERERLDTILGIQADAEALGFRNEFEIEVPHWSVVEVPHGAP